MISKDFLYYTINFCLWYEYKEKGGCLTYSVKQRLSMIEYLFVIEIMLLLLVSEILLVAADLYGGDVGLGIYDPAFTVSALFLVKDVEGNTYRRISSACVEQVFHFNEIVILEANCLHILCTGGAIVKTKAVAV